MYTRKSKLTKNGLPIFVGKNTLSHTNSNSDTCPPKFPEWLIFTLKTKPQTLGCWVRDM